MSSRYDSVMTKKQEFNASEIARAVAEENDRLARVAAYKSRWNQESRAKDIVAYRLKRAATMRDWRAKNRERAREISREGNAKYCAKNPATRRKSAREYNARRRGELLAFFGGKCLLCGFSDTRALHLDHINGGGGKIRAAGGHGLFEKWKMTRDQPEVARATFQLLCANCNCIKRDENYEYSERARLKKAAGL